MLRVIYKISSVWGGIVYFISKRTSNKKSKPHFSAARLLSKSQCNELIKIIDSSDGITLSHIEKNNKIRFLLSSNSVYYHDFPLSVLDDYKFIPSPIQFEAVTLVVERLIPELENFIGTRVSIEVVDLYKTRKTDGQAHVNSKLHTDGDHPSSAKLLIYLNDVLSIEDGPIVISKANKEYVIYEKAGGGVFFYASREHHRGLSPIGKERYCLNLKFYPTIGRSRINADVNQPVNKLAKLFRI